MPSKICPSVLLSTNCSMPSTLCVDFLLPNGLVISLEFEREVTLKAVRDKLWIEVKKCHYSSAGLIAKLKSIDHYLLVSVSQDAKTVEYYDYSKRLCDLKLFYTFFRVVEIQGDLQEKTYYSNLSSNRSFYNFSIILNLLIII